MKHYIPRSDECFQSMDEYQSYTTEKLWNLWIQPRVSASAHELILTWDIARKCKSYQCMLFTREKRRHTTGHLLMYIGQDGEQNLILTRLTCAEEARGR